ncbi:hypothetical protein F5Y12DRAFT_796286 [Xylaria sp. FL1777]|nr:hypothetical protein F5Y12DRAFT_796286 [Xylaria sp. FL1777]
MLEPERTSEEKLCQSLIEHVEAVAFQHRELSEKENIPFFEEFVYLVADASRYLLEIGRYNAVTRLLDHGFHHSKGVESIRYTNLCVNMGQVYCERGQDKLALKYNDIVLRELEKAYEMLQRSHEIDLANKPEDHQKVLHPQDCRTYRMYAEFKSRNGNWDTAYNHAKNALKIAEMAGSTPWVAAALYYMGNIRLKQKVPAEAILHLDQARIICQMGELEKTDKGEYARVIHKLAEAYAAAGNIDKATKLEREANDIYNALIATGLYTKSDYGQEKWDYLICLKFR